MNIIYKEIVNRANDSSWITLASNKSKKYYINPSQINIVQKWRNTDFISPMTDESSPKFPYRLINRTASTYVYAKLEEKS